MNGCCLRRHGGSGAGLLRDGTRLGQQARWAAPLPGATFGVLVAGPYLLKAVASGPEASHYIYHYQVFHLHSVPLIHPLMHRHASLLSSCGVLTAVVKGWKGRRQTR